ncbi:MAG: signal peptidase II [Opitutaceae bacterium]|nr:signal peptidase II [Opitutaceae bacterium]
MADGPPPPSGSAPAVQSGIEIPPSKIQRLAAYRRLLVIAVIVLALDQATKLWINARVPFDPLHTHGVGGDIEVIRGFFYVIHVGNTGAAWSMFAGRSTLLALLACGTLVAIGLWRHSLGLRAPAAQVSFGLLCGGIVGNLIDRLAHGHVIDFLDFHFGSYVYPTFNVADSGICVGVISYLWQSLRAKPASEAR